MSKKPTVGIEVTGCKIVRNDLVTFMKNVGLSQEETAHRAGMTSRQVARILHGQNCPSLERAKALSIVLGTSIENLFTFDVKVRNARPTDADEARPAELNAWEPIRSRSQFRTIPMAQNA